MVRVMSDNPEKNAESEERSLRTEIEVLRGKFPDTQELYREVCVLLFFRHGATPTANRLYQLVHKGSMSAPAEALAKFWATLREKSRVRLEHPDLPEELRDLAGETIGALWQRARVIAEANFTMARSETMESIAQAESKAQGAEIRVKEAEQALNSLKSQLAEGENRERNLEQALSREQGARAALERRETEIAEQMSVLQRAFDEARVSFDRQLSTRCITEERHRADMDEMKLELGRERTMSEKLKKNQDRAARDAAGQDDKNRNRVARLESDLAVLRQKLNGMESALAEARSNGSRLRAHLDKALGKPAKEKAKSSGKPSRSKSAKD
jgi:chromosome segregation ATPase